MEQAVYYYLQLEEAIELEPQQVQQLVDFLQVQQVEQVLPVEEVHLRVHQVYLVVVAEALFLQVQ